MKKGVLKNIVLLLFALFFAGNAQATAGVASNDDIYPEWIKNAAADGLWLGVSPPMDDGEAARYFAISSAVLQYFSATGSADVVGVVNDDIEHLQQGDDCLTENETYLDAAKAVLSNVKVDVVEEFYNSRGEFFVACSIADDSVGSNLSMIVKKEIKTSYAISNNVRTELYNVKNGYLLQIDQAKVEIYFTCKDGSETLRYNLNGRAIDIAADSQQLKYSSKSFAPDRGNGLFTYKVPIVNSLGYTLFRELNYLPLIASKISFSENSFISEDAEKQEFKRVCKYSGSGKAVPLHLCLDKLSKSEAVFFVQPAVAESHVGSGEGFYGWPQAVAVPMWVAKKMSFYSVVGIIVTKIQEQSKGMGSKTQSVFLDNNVAVSNITDAVVVDNFSVDWCVNSPAKMNGNKPVPYVTVYLEKPQGVE